MCTRFCSGWEWANKERDDIVHIMPSPRTDIKEHTNYVDTPCWCNPFVLELCPDCDGHNPFCQTCGGGGLIEPLHDPPEPPLVIIHNRVNDLLQDL